MITIGIDPHKSSLTAVALLSSGDVSATIRLELNRDTVTRPGSKTRTCCLICGSGRGFVHPQALRHGLLSYVYGTGILATAINLVASLSSR